MSERTGLGALETRLLQAVGESKRPRRTESMLVELDREEQVGPSYAVLALRDLGSAWTTTLRLFDLKGNWGSAFGDEMAAARYTEVGLTPAGRVALASERGEVGPVPISLMVGSLWRGGRVPMLDPAATLAVLRAVMAGAAVTPARLAGLVRLPTGGVVAEGLAKVVAGRSTTVTLTCEITTSTTEDGRSCLVISGVPFGVAIDDVAQVVHDRLLDRVLPPPQSYEPELVDDFYEHFPITPVTACHVRDATTAREPIAVQIVLEDERDQRLLPDLEAWVRGLWPVTIETRWHIPGGLGPLVRRWAAECAADPTGLDALEAAIST